jgi:hypothetical protein
MSAISAPAPTPMSICKSPPNQMTAVPASDCDYASALSSQHDQSSTYYTAAGVGGMSESQADRAAHFDLIYSMAPYAQDIYAYNVWLYADRYTPTNYMPRQIDINESMRCILVDWLVDVCVEFKLDVVSSNRHARARVYIQSQECLHLAVNYVDRFLSYRSVYKRHLQLVGAAAIMIAS